MVANNDEAVPESESPVTGAKDKKKDDLLTLATLAKRRRKEAQELLLDRVVAMLGAAGEALSEREQGLIGDILIRLAQDMDAAIRVHFGQTVAGLPALPVELALWLAKQDIETAEPVISECHILNSGDLLEILQQTGRAHALVMARRENIDALISAALVDRKDMEITLALLDNQTAELSIYTFVDLVRASNSVPKLRRPLLNRADLNPALAHSMFWWVSGPLRTRILERFSIGPEEVDATIDQLRQAGFTNDNQSQNEVIPIARARWPERPTANDLIACLREKNPARFLGTIATLLDVQDGTARRIVNDEGGEALAVACRAMDTDRAQFTSVFLLLDYQRYGRPRPTSHIESIADVFNLTTTYRARASIRLWDEGDLVLAA